MKIEKNPITFGVNNSQVKVTEVKTWLHFVLFCHYLLITDQLLNPIDLLVLFVRTKTKTTPFFILGFQMIRHKLFFAWWVLMTCFFLKWPIFWYLLSSYLHAWINYVAKLIMHNSNYLDTAKKITNSQLHGF